MKKRILWMVLIFLSAGMIFFSAEGRTASRFITIGSTTTSSSHYPYFVAVGKIINEFVPEVKATVVATGGSIDNLKRMSKGEVDMSLVSQDALYMAYYGVGTTWKDNPQKNQRVMWLYATTAVHFAVREDSGVKSLYDLHNKKFNPGARGSGTEAATMSILKLLGIEPQYHRGDTADAVSSMKDNRIIGLAKSGVGKQLDASLMDVSTFTPIRILRFTDKEIKKVSAEMPWITWTTVPKGAMKGMDEYQTLSMVNLVPGLDSIPEDLGYRIVKAICEHMDVQEAAFPAVKGLNFPRETLEALASASNPLPLHSGAVKYFKELGLKVPAELIPRK